MSQVEQVYYSSLKILHSASTRFGFLPYVLSEGRKSLKSNSVIYNREALFCTLATLVIDDIQLRNTGIQTIQTIADYMDDIGHVPVSIDTEKNRAYHGMPAVKDIGVWWLIVFWLYTQRLSDTSLKSRYYSHFQEGIQYYQHHLFEGLIEQGEGADWADAMPRSGLVLYTNVVWLLFLQKIQSSEYATVRSNADFFFSVSGVKQKDYTQLSRQFPQIRTAIHEQKPIKNTFIAGISKHSVYTEFDVLSHALLLILGDMNNEQKVCSINTLLAVASESPRLIRCIQQPVRVGRGVQEKDFSNRAWQYQNAGCWPFVAGFVIYALAKNNYIREATLLLERLAQELQYEDSPGYLWAHGKTGKVVGDSTASVSAALYCLAFHAVHQNTDLL